MVHRWFALARVDCAAVRRGAIAATVISEVTITRGRSADRGSTDDCEWSQSPPSRHDLTAAHQSSAAVAISWRSRDRAVGARPGPLRKSADRSGLMRPVPKILYSTAGDLPIRSRQTALPAPHLEGPSVGVVGGAAIQPRVRRTVRRTRPPTFPNLSHQREHEPWL